MAVRLLAPASPVSLGWPATVRAHCAPPAARLRWEWDDGSSDLVELGRHEAGYPRRAHRYAGTGVYRVVVRVPDPPGDPDLDVRYVAVRRRGQVAGSGWIVARGTRVPFAFLVSRDAQTGIDRVAFRATIAAGELVADGPAWHLGGGSGELHFGGSAHLGGASELQPYRVDIRPDEHAARGQQMTISLYAIGGQPGRDSPIERLSGRIRPGRAVISAIAVSP